MIVRRRIDAACVIIPGEKKRSRKKKSLFIRADERSRGFPGSSFLKTFSPTFFHFLREPEENFLKVFTFLSLLFSPCHPNPSSGSSCEHNGARIHLGQPYLPPLFLRISTEQRRGIIPFSCESTILLSIYFPPFSFRRNSTISLDAPSPLPSLHHPAAISPTPNVGLQSFPCPSVPMPNHQNPAKKIGKTSGLMIEAWER